MDSALYRTNAARTTLILGEASCGKTEELIRRITAMLAGGTNPASIAVACASPQAAQDFRRRLAASAGKNADTVRIQPARAFALDVLATPEAVAQTGREPRMLADFEISFLMEDMKTSGLRPRRLKEMLKFFYRTWTELGDWEDGWLLEGEESQVHRLLKDNLAMVRGILEPEAANLAAKALTENADLRSAQSYAHVFVDDYQAQSGASQVLMGLLASESLTIAGCVHECTEGYDSYPFKQGLDLFAKANPACERIELSTYHHASVVHAAVNGLLAKQVSEGALPEMTPAEGVETGTVRFASFERPQDEFDGVATIVREALGSGISPEDITIIAPHRMWGRQVARSLAEQGVAASVLSVHQPLGGDVRDRERSGAALLFTALRLTANPRDAVSWRAWCGFGDYLTHSNSFLKLRALMEEQDLDMPAALAQIEDANMLGADLAKLLPPYEFGMELAHACSELTGMQLLDELAARVEATEREKAAVAAVCAPTEGDDAATLVARAEQSLLAPTFQPDTVRVCAPEQACGQTPRLLVFCGFMNGFVPCRAYFDGAEMPLDKQEKEYAHLVRQLYPALSKAQDTLVCTSFEKTDLETAERLKLKIHRIRMEKGVRVALTERSIFAELLAPAL